MRRGDNLKQSDVGVMDSTTASEQHLQGRGAINGNKLKYLVLWDILCEEFGGYLWGDRKIGLFISYFTGDE